MASSSDDDRMVLTQNSFRPTVSDVSDYHDDSDAAEKEEPVLQLKEEPVLQLKSEKKRFAHPKRDIEMVNITRRRYVCFLLIMSLIINPF